MKKTGSDVEDATLELPLKTAENNSSSQQSYVSLLRTNRPFRLYLTSYLIAHAGEWFTYVASITMMEDFLRDNSEEPSLVLSRTKIAILVVVRLLPNVLLSAVAGSLADARDRRVTMIWLDVMAAVVALLYLVAFQFRSIALVYIVAFAQQSVAALYEPCRSSIVPLMVPNEGDLKKATTLSVLAWSLMAAIGASLGGLFVAFAGVQLCFVVDSASFLASALLVFRIEGQYNASLDAPPYESICHQIKGMTVDGAWYIWSSFFGGIVLVKASGAILFGASDVLNVSFAERDEDDEDVTSLRLGAIFAAQGIGCLLGPLLMDCCILGDRPPARRLQLGCILGLLIVVSGYLGLGMTQSFLVVCLFSAIRAAGSAILWIDSSVILQIFSSPQMLGRVMAVEYALATFMEASSAVLAGYLQDHSHMSAEGVCLVLSAMGVAIVLWWSLFHWRGHGVAHIDSHALLDDAHDDTHDLDERIDDTMPTKSEIEVALIDRS